MENLKRSIEQFGEKRIIVLGDILLDKFCWGNIEKLNPEQPAAPNVNIEYETYALGGAANTANNVASLGGKCKLYGAVGEDTYGKKIKELCDSGGIALICFHNGNPTIVKQRIMAHGQQVARLNHGENKRCEMNNEIKKELIIKLEKDLKETDFIIFSDYNKKFFDQDISQRIIKLANSLGIPTLVDSKPVNINFFENCTIIKANKQEASKTTGITYSNGFEVLKKVGKKLSEIANSKYAVITCGEYGAFSYDRWKEKSEMMKTKARKIADVAGAGDTFAAALALGFSSGLNIFDTSRLANYAAGNVVEKQGVVTTTAEEVLKRIDDEKV